VKWKGEKERREEERWRRNEPKTDSCSKQKGREQISKLLEREKEILVVFA
jgi:hypothetical protein